MVDMDRVKGAAQEIGGRAQQAFGGATGDRSVQAEGVAREVGGRAQGAYGYAKEQLDDLAEEARDRARSTLRQGRDTVREGAHAVERSVEHYPLIYVMAAAVGGFLASMLMNEFFDRRYTRR